METELTLERQAEISQDPLSKINPKLLSQEWRLENLYWIKDKHGRAMKFKMNIVQRFLFKNLHIRNIILKARQLGMSTFIAVLFLDECLFKKNLSAAIVADKVENGKNIFKKIEFAWEMFPKPLKTALGLGSNSDSSTELSWTNGSSFKVGTTLHSGTYQCLHISEYGPLCNASPEKAEDIKKSALPTVPDDGGLVFIESTAEGEGNDFHQMCLDAMELQIKTTVATAQTNEPRPLSGMEYKFFFFPWYEDAAYRSKGPVQIPQRLTTYFNDLEKTLGIKIDIEQRNWYTLKEKQHKKRMKEQYPSTPDEAFTASGNKQFNPDILDAKQRTEVREPIYVDGDLLVYATYKRGHAYGIGGDVADGVGLDSSAAVVMDFTANEVVAVYHSNEIDPVNFAFELLRLGNMYGACIVAPENNRTGHTTCVKLHEVYPNIYNYEIKGYSEARTTTRLGWVTSPASKPLMMNELKSAFEDEENPLIIPDLTILREARMYSKEDNLVTTTAQSAKTTRHFDVLTACAIAWQMRHHATVSLSDPRTFARVSRLRERALAGKRGYK